MRLAEKAQLGDVPHSAAPAVATHQPGHFELVRVPPPCWSLACTASSATSAPHWEVLIMQFITQLSVDLERIVPMDAPEGQAVVGEQVPVSEVECRE